MGAAPIDRDRALEKLKSAHSVGWAVSPAPIAYPAAVAMMERRIAEIRAGKGEELIWLLEHEPIYTGGTSAKPADLIDANRFPVFETSRGGEYTYHGPGQRVAYVMLDLERRGKDVRAFVYALEEWIIRTLGEFGVKGERREGRVGVWIDRTLPGMGAIKEDKIAAIGVRIRKWVSFHGIALNVEPELSHFAGIVPCGVGQAGLGVTSLVDLGLPVTMDEADAALKTAFESVFGPAQAVRQPL